MDDRTLTFIKTIKDRHTRCTFIYSFAKVSRFPDFIWTSGCDCRLCPVKHGLRARDLRERIFKKSDPRSSVAKNFGTRVWDVLFFVSLSGLLIRVNQFGTALLQVVARAQKKAEASFPVYRRECIVYITIIRPYVDIIWSAMGHAEHVHNHRSLATISEEEYDRLMQSQSPYGKPTSPDVFFSISDAYFLLSMPTIARIEVVWSNISIVRMFLLQISVLSSHASRVSTQSC